MAANKRTDAQRQRDLPTIARLYCRGVPQHDLGDGIRAILVDNFADGKNTAFRPCGVKRFDLKFK